MAEAARMQSITSGRIEVVPQEKRASALAKMGRGQYRPLLRTIDRRAGSEAGAEASDLFIGLYAKVGYAGQESLTGLVTIEERIAPIPWANAGSVLPSRLLLIETLTVSSYLSDWQPSVRALLAATAAMLIATSYHDPAFRTFVAFRVPHGDTMLERAVAEISGDAIEVQQDWIEPSLLGSLDISELRFVGIETAKQCAKMVREHMDGSAVPAQPLGIGNDEDTCERVLALVFPRAMHHLEEELAVISAGERHVAWRQPELPDNDRQIGTVLNARGG